LEKAYVFHDAGLRAVKIDLVLRDLHGDPRWTTFLKKMNLPPDSGCAGGGGTGHDRSRDHRGRVSARLLRRGAVRAAAPAAAGRPRIEAIGPRDRPRIADLLARYASLPMDYADATLILLAERLNATRIFTLDRRDFSLYRAGRRRFEVVPV
jgi:hypothetical protein